jgi:hypothetical protein
MDKFLDTYSLPKLSQEYIKHLNRLVTGNEIESVIKTLPTKRNKGQYGFTAEFYQILKNYTNASQTMSQNVKEANPLKSVL